VRRHDPTSTSANRRREPGRSSAYDRVKSSHSLRFLHAPLSHLAARPIDRRPMMSPLDLQQRRAEQ
jgi:hypothetical protein